MAVTTIESVLMVGHEDTLSSTLLRLAVLLNGTDRSVLINAEIRESSEFDVLMDVFLSLGSGVDFLLFLFLTSLDGDQSLKVHKFGV